MADHAPNQEPPQQLVGFRTNGEWQDLLAQSGVLIDGLETIEDEAQRKAVFDALDAIDSIHREALHRLVRLFKEGVIEQVVTDPAINTLMGMYGLLPEREPGCQKVWDFLPKDDEAKVPEREISTTPAEQPPHWTPIPARTPPETGKALVCRIEEGHYIVAKIDDHLYAMDALCGFHHEPMIGGRLEGCAWICPHGPACNYDMRSGARLGGGVWLDCRPVKSDDAGRVLIGFGMPFEPKLPAF